MQWGRWGTRIARAFAIVALVACSSTACDSGDDDVPTDAGRDDRGAQDAEAGGLDEPDGAAVADSGAGGSDAGGSDAGDEQSELQDFTFFVWSDIHVDEGSAYHLDAFDGANTLAGTSFPDEIGGVVAEPDFILDCGDMVEWPSWGSVEEYIRAFEELSQYPIWPVLGNHDLVNTSGSPVMENWFLENITGSDLRFDYDDPVGAPVEERSYSFLHKGIAFIGLSHSYSLSDPSPAQPIPDADRAWIRGELARYDADVPVILWLHLGITAIVNPGGLTVELAGHRVVLVLGGHYHFSHQDRVEGVDFIQVGSPKPGEDSEPTLLVVRVEGDTLTAAHWDYRARAWAAEPTFTTLLEE